MSIEIEMRGVRWRSVGRPLSVETPADRRAWAARSSLPAAAPLPAGQTLRSVWPLRSVPTSRLREKVEGAGGIPSNLRADIPEEARRPEAGFPLDAKD